MTTTFPIEEIRRLRTEGKREQAREQLRALSGGDALQITWQAVKIAGEWLALEEYDEAERIYDLILTHEPDHTWARRGKTTAIRGRGLPEPSNASQHKARSAASSGTTGTGIRPAPNARLMNIGIVGNCQAEALSELLATAPGVGEIKILPVQLFGAPVFAQAVKAFRELSLTPEFLVISQVLGKRFEDFETPRLKEQHKVMTITNVHFTGLHPDITYLGEQGLRMQSPLGDYHSKLILHSFVSGLSEEGCRGRFRAAEYERVGFFSEYASSAQELRKRDKGIDIPFAARFLDMVREVPSLFTFNHPTGIVLQEMAGLIAARLGVPVFHRQPNGMVQNHFRTECWWPVYPELGEAAKLKYSTPMRFKQPMRLGGKYLDLDEMIAGSYKVYEKNSEQVVSLKQPVELMGKWAR